MSSLIAEKELKRFRPFPVLTNAAATATTLSSPAIEIKPVGSSLEQDETTMREMVATSLDHVLHHINTLSSKPVNDSSRGRAVAREMQEALPKPAHLLSPCSTRSSRM